MESRSFFLGAAFLFATMLKRFTLSLLNFLRIVRLRRSLIAACAFSMMTATVILTAHHSPAVEAPSVQPNPSSEMVVYQPGEELEYAVSFFTFRLGTVRIKTDNVSQHDGRPAWRAFCYADSREGIPFVSLHVVFESSIDEQGGYSHAFMGSDLLSDGKWMYSKYVFDHPRNLVTIENGQGSNVWKRIEIQSPLNYCDGLSLLFYARRNAMYKKTVNVPTLIQNDTARTAIFFRGERESTEIEAVPYPVDCNHFEGNATWTGIYGLTGHFEGWFSNDNASVPIKARIKLTVGSAYLELVKWRRAGWAPPKAG